MTSNTASHQGKDTPISIVEASDLSRHIRGSMNKNRKLIRGSLRRQLAGTIAYALNRAATGQPVIYPGMTRMADWGECSERVARENFAELRGAGIVVPVAYERGGRRSTRFIVDLQAVLRFLTGLGSRISKALQNKLMACRLFVRESLVNKVSGAHRNPEATSAGKKEESPQSVPVASGLPFRVALMLSNLWPWARLPARERGKLLAPGYLSALISRPDGLRARSLAACYAGRG